MRTLCHDIGHLLGCGAHMSRLRRLRSGSFPIAESVTMEKLGRLDLRGLSEHVRVVQELV